MIIIYITSCNIKKKKSPLPTKCTYVFRAIPTVLVTCSEATVCRLREKNSFFQ